MGDVLTIIEKTKADIITTLNSSMLPGEIMLSILENVSLMVKNKILEDRIENISKESGDVNGSDETSV